MGIKLSTESAIVVPELYRSRFGVHVLPLHILYGEESFDDAVTINVEGMLARYRETNELPTTSACSIGEYAAYFGALTEDGSEVVHFSMSSGVSSTYRNACIAAQEFPGVSVVDTQSLTSGGGLLLVKAGELMQTGFSAKEIVRRTEEAKRRVRVSFMVDSLTFMRKGGRCSALAAFGANILGIRPSIEIRNGTMDVAKKFRGKYESCLLKYVDDLFAGAGRPDESRVWIEYTPGVTPEQLDAVKKEIKKFCKFEEVLELPTTSTIFAHAGPGTVGVMFMEA